jgi:molybdenum transport protein
MIYFSENDIETLIKEDVPYFDLTTEILQIGDKYGKLEYRVREDAVVSSTEEVAKIFDKLGIKLISLEKSGTFVQRGELILSGEGSARSLHMAWKVGLNILEYCLGVSTASKKLIDKAKKSNPDVPVFFTRKSFPGTKSFVAKAAISGGILPHRLGLSETILIFDNHLKFIGGYDNLIKILPEIKKQACEKKVIVEVEDFENAKKMAYAGVDGIQFDKVSCADLQKFVVMLKEKWPQVTLIAAGGINQENIEEYVKTGVDAIVTSCVFHGKPLDISAKMFTV